MKAFHGVVNTGGLCERLAGWQREHGHDTGVAFIVTNKYVPENAHSLRLDRHGYAMQLLRRLMLFLEVLVKYRVLFFYSGQTILPRGLDLPLYRLFRKTITMIYTGSDIRLARLEAARNPTFAQVLATATELRKDRQKSQAMHWHGRWIDHLVACRLLADSARGNIPDRKLVKHVPVINAIDVRTLTPRYFEGGRVRVIHAPTNDRIKGTPIIEAAMAQLCRSRGDVTYRTIRGVTHARLMEIIRDDADVVVDQVVLGDFGNVSVEAMALGKVVCCFLLPQVIMELPDIPIVNCSAMNLQTRLEHLLEDQREIRELGQRGRSFVQSHFEQESLFLRVTRLGCRRY